MIKCGDSVTNGRVRYRVGADRPGYLGYVYRTVRDEVRPMIEAAPMTSPIHDIEIEQALSDFRQGRTSHDMAIMALMRLGFDQDEAQEQCEAEWELRW